MNRYPFELFTHLKYLLRTTTNKQRRRRGKKQSLDCMRTLACANDLAKHPDRWHSTIYDAIRIPNKQNQTQQQKNEWNDWIENKAPRQNIHLVAVWNEINIHRFVNQMCPLNQNSSFLFRCRNCSHEPILYSNGQCEKTLAPF